MHAHAHTCEECAWRVRERISFLLGLCLKLKNECNKWKNNFYEMKGDVGTSSHEKERNKKMPTARQKAIHNPIPTSLFLSRSYPFYVGIWIPLCFCAYVFCVFSAFKATFLRKAKK